MFGLRKFVFTVLSHSVESKRAKSKGADPMLSHSTVQEVELSQFAMRTNRLPPTPSAPAIAFVPLNSRG